MLRQVHHNERQYVYRDTGFFSIHVLNWIDASFGYVEHFCLISDVWTMLCCDSNTEIKSVTFTHKSSNNVNLIHFRLSRLPSVAFLFTKHGKKE